MDLLLLLEPLVQTCLRVLEVAALVILLLLDVNIDFDVLRVTIADMFVKALVDHFLQRLEVIDMLHGPVNVRLHLADQNVIVHALEAVLLNTVLHRLLAVAQVFDHEAEVRVHRVVVLELGVHLTRLLPQGSDLSLTRCNHFSKLLDLVIEHELEFLQLLRLFLQDVDLLLLFADLLVALFDLLFHFVDSGIQRVFLLPLNIKLLFLSEDLTAELINRHLEVLQLGGRHLLLGVGVELHGFNLCHVLSVLLHDVLLFLLGVVLDLSDDFSEIKLHRIDLLLKLLSGGSRRIHGKLVLVHQLVDIRIVRLDRVSDNLLESGPLILLVLLQVLEVGRILQHASRVLLPVLLELDLVGLSRVADLLLLVCLHLPLAVHQRVVAGALRQSERR